MRRCDLAEVVLLAADRERVIGTVPEGACDLELVDALSRLQLAAIALGHRIYVRRPSEELRGLLELVGLRELLAGGSSGRFPA